jgi:Cdc6-like AAA superfamily ATPase
MVKLHELILTFDTNKSNELIEAQAIHLIDEINRLLCKHFKDSLPQIYKDPKKKSKISVVPITPEDADE